MNHRISALLTFAATATLVLGACDPDDTETDETTEQQHAPFEPGDAPEQPPDNAVDDEMLDEIGEGLDPGEHELIIDGDVEIVGQFDAGDPADIAPTSDGTNVDGPYRLRIRKQVQRDDDPIAATATIELPEGASRKIYELRPRGEADPDEDEAVARFEAAGRAWLFNSGIEGEVIVGDIEHDITAAFEFEAEDDDGDTVQVSGRVYQLPFDYSAVVRATRTIDGEDHDVDWGASYYDADDDIYPIRVGRAQESFSMMVPGDIDPGSYELQMDADNDDEQTIRVVDDDFQQVDGTLEIEREGNFAHGEFELEATGDQPEQITGHFEYIDVVSGEGSVQGGQ